MSSTSLIQWQQDRIPRLKEIDLQCDAAISGAPCRQQLVEENLRAYSLLLSAHFQGFCRDLYTESAQIIASKVRASLQLLVQEQFSAHRKLDRGNPSIENIRADFQRFGFNLDFKKADQANATRVTLLGKLNDWRNAAAHHGAAPIHGPLNLSSLRSWRNACDGLAASLDWIMYNELRRILRRAPW